MVMMSAISTVKMTIIIVMSTRVSTVMSCVSILIVIADTGGRGAVVSYHRGQGSSVLVAVIREEEWRRGGRGARSWRIVGGGLRGGSGGRGRLVEGVVFGGRMIE